MLILSPEWHLTHHHNNNNNNNNNNITSFVFSPEQIRSSLVMSQYPQSTLLTAFRRQAFHRPRPMTLREGKKAERMERLHREEQVRKEQKEIVKGEEGVRVCAIFCAVGR